MSEIHNRRDTIAKKRKKCWVKNVYILLYSIFLCLSNKIFFLTFDYTVINHLIDQIHLKGIKQKLNFIKDFMFSYFVFSKTAIRLKKSIRGNF